MSSRTNGFVIFLAGAAAGSLLTWQYAKRKYAKLAQEEIDSVKAVFRGNAATAEDEDAEPPKVNPIIEQYVETLKNAGYTNYSEISGTTERKEGATLVNKPYIIPPEDFAEQEGYDTVSLIYYSDGTLADDNDDLVEDIAVTVGEDFPNHFGEYEEDSVFVRNDQLKCDYEILRDQRTYEDAIRNTPRWSEYVNS